MFSEANQSMPVMPNVKVDEYSNSSFGIKSNVVAEDSSSGKCFAYIVLVFFRFGQFADFKAQNWRQNERL